MLTEPKVGVGCVILRHLTHSKVGAEVLLIRRGKPPSLHQWSFPGGSLELGETIIDCAIRETLEETGITLRNRHTTTSSKPLLSPTLDYPSVFTAVDVMEKEKNTNTSVTNDRLAFHYAVVEVAAVPEDYKQEPKAGDDAETVAWIPIEELKNMEDTVPLLVDVVDEALSRFTIQKES